MYHYFTALGLSWCFTFFVFYPSFWCLQSTLFYPLAIRNGKAGLCTYFNPVVDMHRPFGQVYKVANEFRELAGGERYSITDIRGRGYVE